MAGKLKDGIDNVVVVLDREDVTYKAGSRLSGVIEVFCEETTAVRGIRLKLLGRMNIYWRKVDGGQHLEYAEIEDYLDEDILIWAPKLNKKNEMWMFPGKHEYKFDFDLPVDLPDTLEDSRYGKVVYYARASVYMTQQRVSHSMEEPFYIITSQDPAVPKPVDEDMPKENAAYEVIGGSCFQGKTYVELYLRLQKNHYRLGEVIPVHVECRIEGGSSNVAKVTALLVQETIYTVSPGEKDEARKKEYLVMAESCDTEDTDKGECQNYELALKVDDRLPLTDYPWCDFIQMGYSVHVVARTPRFYDDVVVKLPVIINPTDGEIPAAVAPDEVIVQNPEDNLGQDGEDPNALIIAPVDIDDEDDEEEKGEETDEDKDESDEEDESNEDSD